MSVLRMWRRPGHTGVGGGGRDGFWEMMFNLSFGGQVGVS